MGRPKVYQYEKITASIYQVDELYAYVIRAFDKKGNSWIAKSGIETPWNVVSKIAKYGVMQHNIVVYKQYDSGSKLVINLGTDNVQEKE